MPFEAVSGVGREMGVLDGSGDRRRGKGGFRGKCRASRCNRWGLCGVFSTVRSGDAVLPKLLWDFLLLMAVKKINKPALKKR